MGISLCSMQISMSHFSTTAIYHVPKREPMEAIFRGLVRGNNLVIRLSLILVVVLSYGLQELKRFRVMANSGVMGLIGLSFQLIRREYVYY